MLPYMTVISCLRGFSSKARGGPANKRALRVRIDCAPPASLGHTLSLRCSPKTIEFAGRNGANLMGMGTYGLRRPSGPVLNV
jgi:hypothetical protein